MKYQPIENYAVIVELDTVVLISVAYDFDRRLSAAGWRA